MSFHRFITVLLIGVVLINVIGPILDHHFVERGHNHDHLYLSVTAADHSHVYDSKHIHKSHVSNVSRTLSDSDDNIVFLTKDNGMQIFGAYTNSDVIQESEAHYPSLGPILRPSSGWRVPFGYIIAPIKQPPIF